MSENGTRIRKPVLAVPPPAERDCGRLGHIFEVLCDLDKVPRYAKCPACHKEWAFMAVMEVRRIP